MIDDPVLARRRHYGEFYGLQPLPERGTPLLIVHGNCQAEALRVVIDASASDLATVRIPPVHELTADDLPMLAALLQRVDVLASQPVSPGYRDLPIGTDELARLAPRAAVIRWPVVRYVGLHPHGALIRKPWRGDPPVVPYHDLRTLTAHARGTGPHHRPLGHGAAEGYRAVARASLAALRAREEAGALVPASDLIEAAGADAMHTINHPANDVLVPLAGRILTAAGSGAAPVDPGRTLLGAIYAPIDAAVLEAQDLPTDRARARWLSDGRELDSDEIVAAQYAWYDGERELVEVALRRYAPAIEALGL